jgi:hypothetical protein
MAFTLHTFVANAKLTAAQLNGIESNFALIQPSIADDGTIRNLLIKATTEQEVINSNAETNILSWSIPGGTLGTGNVLRLMVSASIDVSSVATALYLKVTYGGTQLAGGYLCTTVPTKGAYLLTVLINGNNATNAQRSVTTVHGVLTGQVQTNNGEFTGPSATGTLVAVHNAVAVDSTVNQVLNVSVQWATAQSTAHFKRHAALLEVLRT